ncbi:MAG: pitrilysin family protein [Planctomycetota bacterium]|nr:pitrilysin family protein [Planctomycetota bacterium]
MKPPKELTVAALVAMVLLLGCESPVKLSSVKPPSVKPSAAGRRTPPLDVSERVVTDDGVVVAKLANGLTVAIKPMRTSPVVCVRAYVRAGGLYEREWLGCGLSHLVEHLVAKGAAHETAAGQARQTSNRIADIGGQSNAYTSLDSTCYYISAAADKTTECVDLIADWLARAAITREDFEREHGVVQRELEMGKDSPNRQMWYAHTAGAFSQHPAAVPVIGWAAPLAKITRADVLAYHRRMYVPQNMVFCVVGDVDAEAVLARIRRAFAGFAPGRAPDLSLPEVRPITGIRRAVRSCRSLKNTMQRMSFQTVPLSHEDLYALDVLSYVLSSGRASWLVRKIKREKRLATSISTTSWTPGWGKGLFTVAFRSEPDKADAAEQAILDELRAVAEKGIGEAELDRAKRQKVADYVHSQQTAESVAATLATDYMSTGDVMFSKNYTERIQAVTAGQVRNVARKYFTFDRMVITRMAPKLDHDPAAGAGSAKKYDKQTFKLKNGLRVILQPADTGLVSMAYVAGGGVLTETERTNGLSALMAALATRGTENYTAGQIDEFFDNAGGSISGDGGNNSLYWQATVLQDSFDEAIEIFAEVISRPTFDQKELEILRPVLLARIKQGDEHWFGQLQKFFRDKFFTNSPYRLLPVGDEKIIRTATVAQAKAWHDRWITGGDSVLAVYGEFDLACTRRAVEKLFSGLPAGRKPADALPAPAARKVADGGELHVLKTTNKQAAIMVAVPGMTIDNLQDRFALDVLDTIISGYRLPAGWLHSELRGRQLVYVVHAYNWPGLAPGAFITHAACQPEKAGQVIRIIRKHLRRAANYKPTQREIDRAVGAILTAKLLENQSMEALSIQAALDELYGLGHDFHNKLTRHYRAVKPADVLRVGRKYLSGGFVVTVTTPQPEMLDQN